MSRGNFFFFFFTKIKLTLVVSHDVPEIICLFYQIVKTCCELVKKALLFIFRFLSIHV